MYALEEPMLYLPLVLQGVSFVLCPCNILTRGQFKQGSRILFTDKDLNGTLRVAVEGMATEEQCKMLIKLAEVCSLF